MSDNYEKIAAALVKIQTAIKGVEKNKTVGTGFNQYQGVGDVDVKLAVRSIMSENGIVILPIGIEPTVRVERWEENGKPKQQVLTEVKTKYRVLHSSGQYIDVVGYGHGIDAQDKSAGKATTYALKYLLLYLFQIPTGAIDDSDNDSSADMQTPPTPKQRLEAAQTAEELAAVWNALTADEKTANQKTKDELKSKFSKNGNTQQ